MSVGQRRSYDEAPALLDPHRLRAKALRGTLDVPHKIISKS